MPTETPAHHGVPIRRGGSLVTRVLQATGVNLATSPLNLFTMPRAGDVAESMGIAAHSGTHLGSYYTGIQNALNSILTTPGLTQAERALRVERLVVAIRMAVQSGELLNNATGTGLTRAQANTHNRAFFASLNAYLTNNLTSIDALITQIRQATPDGAATGRSLLLGYNNSQLATLSDRLGAHLSPDAIDYIADLARNAPTSANWSVAIRRLAAFTGTVVGAGILAGLKRAGFVGNVVAAVTLYEDLGNATSEVQQNRLWAEFLGQTMGGMTGATLGALGGGGLASIPLSVVGSIAGSVWLGDKFKEWYDNPDNTGFRGLVEGIADTFRSVTGSGSPQLAAALARQLPEAIATLVGGQSGYQFKDANGDVIISVAYGGDGNVYIVGPNGTTQIPVSLEAMSEALREFIAAEFIEWARERAADIFRRSEVDFEVQLASSDGFSGAPFVLPGQVVPDRVIFIEGRLLPQGATAALQISDEIVVTAESRPIYAIGTSIDDIQYYYSDLTPIPASDHWRVQIGAVLSPENAGAEPDSLAAYLISAYDAARLRNDTSEQVDASGALQSISYGQLGSIFGSNLAKLIQTDEPWESMGIGTLLGTIGQNIGQAIDAASAGVSNPLRAGFRDFPQDLMSAGIGAVGSYLFAEFLEDLGVDGIAGELANSLGGAAIGQIADNIAFNIANGNNPFSNAFEGISDTGIYLNALGSFLGAKLASELIQFDTIGGQIGASIGSGIGGIIGAAKIGAKIGGTFGGPIGAFIGAFVGYILGGLIGSLFGGTPKAGAALAWDESDRRFEVGRVWSKNGGSKDAVRSMANQVGELLNGVVAAAGSRVADVKGIQTGAYDQKGSRFIYKASMEGNYAFSSKDMSKVINHGSFIALDDLSKRLIGGNVHVKRALSASLLYANGNPDSYSAYSAGDFEIGTLFGNISTAQDYANYLQNAEVINALIAAEPNSAFTAGWTITFARVIDLGLDRRWSSDWLGGWAAFLDETADGIVDGSAYAPANVFLELDHSSSERLFIFADANGELLGVLGDTIDTLSKDIIEGSEESDAITIIGDVIELSSGLNLNGETAEAGAHKIRVAALIDGGAGNDTIRGGDLGNDLLGGEGNDTLIGGKLDDWQFGGEGDDRLFAGAATNTSFSDAATDAGNEAARNAALAVDGGNGDYLEGGAGEDALYGGLGSDWLSGGDGADILRSGAGGDILDGGFGDERGSNGEARLLGGAGSDQYVFYLGAGHDVIFDAADASAVAGVGLYGVSDRYASLGQNPGAMNWAGNGDYEVDGSVVGGEDAIAFGAGIGFEDLRLRRGTTSGVVNADLIIELVDENGVLTGDSLTIKDWFDETRRVEWLRFADGQDIRIGDLSSFVIGTAAADNIVGTQGNDWVVGLGGGDDISLLAGNDFGFGGKGNDIVAGDADNDFISGGDDADQVMGGAGNDTVFGDEGDDVVAGDEGNDIIAGGRGDDEVSGGAGDDLYRYWRGDGHDTVFDGYAAATTESVIVNGAYVNGYDLAELLAGEDWAVSLRWDGSTNSFVRRIGGGAATINAGASDVFEFGFGIDIEDVQIWRSGGDLELAIGAGAFDASAFLAIDDRITFQEWFSSGVQIEKFVFVETGQLDMLSWTLGVASGNGAITDGDDVASGTSGRDWITGGLGDDTLSGLAGDDILSGNFGADQLSGGDGDDVIYGGADNDTLEGGAGADKIFGGAGEDIASYASVTQGILVSLDHQYINTLEAADDALVEIEGLIGGAGADRLFGDDGDNTLQGAGGADTLKGSFGDDTYEVNAAQGDDMIADRGTTMEEIIGKDGQLNPACVVSWEMVDITDLWGVYWYRHKLIVTLNGETIYSSRLNDFKYTSEVADVPPPGSWPYSDSQWAGGIYRTGNGVQTIRETIETGDAGYDTLELGPNISLADVTASLTNAGADLKLSFSAGGSATLRDQFYVNAGVRERAIEEIVLADGLSANLANLVLPGAANGSNGDDLFMGASAADTFDGGAGDDVISGGADGDTLSGGDGDDTLEGGAGADVLDGGADSVTSDHAALASDPGSAYGDTIRYVSSSAGVIVDLSARTVSGRDAAGLAAAVGDAAGDTIAAYTSGGVTVSSIENVVGSSGYVDTLRGDDRANRLSGLGGDDIIEGRNGDDVLLGGAGADQIDGGDGADAIYGDDGADAIFGGAGDDIIEGGAGADAIEAGAGVDKVGGGDGDDLIDGGEGDDTLRGEAGGDLIYGGAGADTLVGGEGGDVLRGEAGDDIYLFDVASGADQIIDAAGANNRIFLDGVSFDQVWLTRAGDDLVVAIIGSTSQILVKNYYAASGNSLMRSIGTSGHTLFLASAEPMIEAMTVASATPPASVPTQVQALHSTYWHVGEKSAPQLADQALSTDEDTPLSGQVGAVDHDGETMTYTLQVDAAHGDVALNAVDGTWVYTPDAQWNGADSFKINVTDTTGNITTQLVSVDVAAVNDAPVVSPTSFAIDENVATGTPVGALVATDVEGQNVTFTQQTNAGGRFAVSSTGQITIANGALIDFEAGASFTVTVTATDAGGASLGPQDITITLNDLNEAPTALGLANSVTTLAEDTSTTTRVKVADLVITDDALGSESLALSGADAASFEIDNGALYLKAGVSLNFEAKTSYAVTVTVDDATIGSGVELSEDFTLAVGDVNEAPTALVFANAIASLAEETSTATRIKVADLALTDDALGIETFGLSGADADSFEIIGAGLYLKAGVALDYEAKPSFSVTVNVDDTSLGSATELSQQFVLAISDGNEAPQGLSFANTLTTIAENNSTGTRTKVADLVVNDDALGALVYGLTGTDAASFEIIGTELFLKAGVALNYEAKASYDVSVTVDDPSIGAGVELSQALTLFVSDINEAPTGLAFSNTTTSIAENTSTASRTKVADLSYGDDALGTESFGLSGADAASFEIIGTALYLKAGVALNFEAKASYAVNVTLDDASVGGTPDLSQAFTLTITNVNEAPTAMALSNTTSSLAENTSTATRIKVADIVITDDALGTETLVLSGADAASFEIDGAVLYLKAGVALNYETKTSYAVTVAADDPAVGASPDVSQNFTLNVSNVNETPTGLTFSNTTTSIAENTSTASRTKVADLSYSDDALGTEAFALSGADAASFEIIGTSLYLKAGVALNYESKAAYAVNVTLDDASVGGTPDLSQGFTLSITDANEAPTALAFNNAVTSITENTSTTSRVKIADLALVDDALGAETFALSGTDAASFEIIGTELYLKAGVVLNYEAKTSYAITVSADDTSVGATPDASQSFTLSVTNVNEAPYGSPATLSHIFQYGVAANTVIGTASPVDPDGTTTFTFAIVSAPSDKTYSINASTGQLRVLTEVSDGTYEIDNVVVRFTDPGGLTGTQTFNIKYNKAYQYLPVVLDLDGDGVELVSFANSNVQFDLDGDGILDDTGWVGADDALLVLDRNNDGAIDTGAEISFAGDLSGASSDIEGLAAYDSNENGFFDEGDAQFGAFQIWRDQNQDGVSQSSELMSLGQAGVVAINLTLTLTGAETQNAADNVIYGTTNYVGNDGVVRAVGDVILAYSSSAASGMPPIIFDLDGGGLSLTGRLASNVLFDADGNGVVERTGWFGPGEGVLALDRNDDGIINSGAEISFANDLAGASTDLEGLAVYDSNENGFFDEGDSQFAKFQIWQDANQDGVSQGGELRSLVDWNIRALNLTPTLTGASIENIRDNVIYATTEFVRGDGTLGLAGDVYLSFDGEPLSQTAPSGVTPTEDADEVDRRANNRLRRRYGHVSNPYDSIAQDEPGEFDAAIEQFSKLARNWRHAKSAEADVAPSSAKPVETVAQSHVAPIAEALKYQGAAARASTLHAGLALADKRVLHMVNAMAGFEPNAASDLARSSRRRDPKVAALLTSLPDLR